MPRKSRYRLTLWLTVLSALILAAALAATSLRIMREGRRFTDTLLEENRAFLRNTLRFSHQVMMSRAEGRNNYQALIEMALRSRFVRYIALLDPEGTIMAQSELPQTLAPVKMPPPEDLRDGTVLYQSNDLLLVVYRAEEPEQDKAMGVHHAGAMMAGRSMLARPAWYVVALDTSSFRHHYHDMLIQTVGVGMVFFLLGTLAIVFLGIVQRYELAHVSLEKLQRIKRVLGHFVPQFAKQAIERDPERKGLLDKYLQDATVMFLDIENFTRIVERYPQEIVNRSIELHFSRFLDLIQKLGGDVNETAGDGMMVIFLHSDPRKHALNAARTAISIRDACRELASSSKETLAFKVNIGVQSGQVYLGSTKMRGSEAERWTFTASGAVTVMAARLAQAAAGGQILLGTETAQRLGEEIALRPLGRVSLKNMRESVEVYEI